MLIYSNTEKLVELLKTVLETDYSSFYANKYSKELTAIKLSISGQEQNKNILDIFQSLPILTRKDIADTPPDERLYIPKSEVSFVSYTSGTTDGKPLVLYWSPVADYFFEPSIGTASRTPLILHPALNKNFGHTFIQQCRQAQTPVTPVFADFQNLTHSAILAGQTLADGMFTTPTIASLIAEPISKYYKPEQIKLLALFSENLTTLKRENLKKQYPNAEIANLYASSEVGQLLFYPCRRMIEVGSNEFHFIDKAIVALELAEDGELILTIAQNKAFPLIRYRTGDFFEVQDLDKAHRMDAGVAPAHACSCGLNTPILSWSGRMDVDKLRINGVEIKAEDIEYALKDCVRETGDAYQIHFYSDTKAGSETIVLVVEIQESEQNPMSEFGKIEAKEKIQKALLEKWNLTASATLQTAVDKGLFKTPEVIFVKELSLKTLKTRRLVNHIV